MTTQVQRGGHLPKVMQLLRASPGLGRGPTAGGAPSAPGDAMGPARSVPAGPWPAPTCNVLSNNTGAWSLAVTPSVTSSVVRPGVHPPRSSCEAHVRCFPPRASTVSLGAGDAVPLWLSGPAGTHPAPGPASRALGNGV